MPKSPLDEFDPNSKPKQPFATYCPTRRNGSAFKTHATRGSAINGLRYQGCGALYRWEDKWVEIARFEYPDFRAKDCENCGTHLMQHPTRYDYRTRQHITRHDLARRNVGVSTFLRTGFGGKLLEPLKVIVLCKSCKSSLGF